MGRKLPPIDLSHKGSFTQYEGNPSLPPPLSCQRASSLQNWRSTGLTGSSLGGSRSLPCPGKVRTSPYECNSPIAAGVSFEYVANLSSISLICCCSCINLSRDSFSVRLSDRHAKKI